MSVLLAFTVAALFSTGTFLLLQRRLSRILIGIGLVGHGTNLLLVISGGDGGLAPIIGTGDGDDFADPLPQAFALTSIVITFGVTAFLLALGFRSWQIDPRRRGRRRRRGPVRRPPSTGRVRARG